MCKIEMEEEEGGGKEGRGGESGDGQGVSSTIGNRMICQQALNRRTCSVGCRVGCIVGWLDG